MVQSTPVSNNSLLYDAGQGAGEGVHSKTDHDMMFRYCLYPLEVEYEDTGGESVEHEHGGESNSETPEEIVISNHTKEREGTKDDSHYQGEIH